MDFAANTPELQKQRLAALRAAMAAQQLDGFFVPLSDEYMNEYVPAHAQRLAWLTGFTGSAGFAVVLKDKAALFIDGRYTLQAEQQVDKNIYEQRHVVRQPLDEFLKANLTANQKIGYDPWLHTKASLDKIRAICIGKNAKLVAVTENLIDALWQARPAVPMAPINPHPVHYAGESAPAKIARIAIELHEKGLSGAVITSPASIAWLLNVRGHDVENTPLPLSYLILSAQGRVEWFVHLSKVMPETQKTLPPEVTLRAQQEFIPALKVLAREKPKLRVDARHTPSAVLDALADNGAFLDEGLDPLELPKAKKNNAELEGMRDAHKRDGLALTRFLCWLSAHGAGRDEMALEDQLLAFRKMDENFLFPSFPSISGAGPNGAIVHYRATEKTKRVLKNGDIYLIDSGGQYRSGTTDVTRTIAIGTPTAEMKKHYTLVLKGHIALALARFPDGTAGNQLDVLARRALWAEGLDYDHGTGHGVGAFLGVHEGPQGISGRSMVPLQAGMILSNEPGFYKTDAYGIRIENLVAVKESSHVLDGKRMLEFETLTLAPMDAALIDVDMLEKTERAWLNAYHAQVCIAHKDKLSEKEREWLIAATRSL